MGIDNHVLKIISNIMMYWSALSTWLEESINHFNLNICWRYQNGRDRDEGGLFAFVDDTIIFTKANVEDLQGFYGPFLGIMRGFMDICLITTRL